MGELVGAPVDWIEAHLGLLAALGSGSLVPWVLGLALAPLAIADVPQDYFVRPRRLLARLRSNLLGWSLEAVGVLLLVAPGQGVSTLLLGASLADFPGKARVLGWALRRPAVARALQRVRRKAGREHLQLPER